MKTNKLLLTTLFSLISSLIFAQSKWSTTSFTRDDCFKGISISVSSRKFTSAETKDYGVWIKVNIKNTYNKKVHVSLKVWIDGDLSQYAESQGARSGLFTIAANSTSTDTDIPVNLSTTTTRLTWRYLIETVCFADSWGGCSESIDGWPRFAECDNGTPNFTINKKGNSNSIGNNTSTNGSNNTNTNSNNNPTGESTQSLLDELNKLCSEASTIDNTYTKGVYNQYCNSETYSDTESGRSKIKARIGYLKDAIKTGNSNNKIKEDLAARKLEREEKTKQLKKDLYNDYMEDANRYMGQEEYDKAITSFGQALEKADDESDRMAASSGIARAQKAKEDAARRVRVAEKQEVEKKQNDGTTAAIGGFAGAMALVKDNYSNDKFAAKFQIGLGYGNNPLIVNSVKQFKTSIKDNNQILFHLGFNLTVLNKKGINFELKPSLGIGLASYQKGTDGGGEEYGGTGILWLAPKATSTFKLFAEGGYFFRNGKYNYDQDVALGPTSTTDNVEKGEFKYKLLRYGGGFKISFINDEFLESYIKPAMFLEMPSFFTKTTKPTMVFNVQAYVLSNALLDFSYSKNYYIPGKIDYFGSFTKENKNYFSIKIIRQGKLK